MPGASDRAGPLEILRGVIGPDLYNEAEYFRNYHELTAAVKGLEWR